MSKLTLDHLTLSREIELMIQQGNIELASKHYDQRKDRAEQAQAFLDSPENRMTCSGGLRQAVINALACMTLPENADRENLKWVAGRKYFQRPNGRIVIVTTMWYAKFDPEHLKDATRLNPLSSQPTRLKPANAFQKKPVGHFLDTSPNHLPTQP